MRNKIMKRMIATVGVIACCLSLSVVPVASISAQAAVPANESVSPCAEILEWVYRITDGKIYKRLFNCTTQQWAGKWIYVGKAA